MTLTVLEGGRGRCDACAEMHDSDLALFCTCDCHTSPPLTEAMFAAGVRAMSEAAGMPVPEWARIRPVDP